MATLWLSDIMKVKLHFLSYLVGHLNELNIISFTKHTDLDLF